MFIYLNKFLSMPMPQDIQKIFAPYYNAEANIWERFSEKITVREFQKNEVIKDYQGVEKYLNIVAKGSVGLFVWNGKKISVSIYCMKTVL
jgi:signal-transduction protein with cAMP-binding, CBS, and nucleotidyltransferase domain